MKIFACIFVAVLFAGMCFAIGFNPAYGLIVGIIPLFTVK